MLVVLFQFIFGRIIVHVPIVIDFLKCLQAILILVNIYLKFFLETDDNLQIYFKSWHVIIIGREKTHGTTLGAYLALNVSN